MIYIDSFHFPTVDEINNYMNRNNYTPYPWNLFLYNGLEWIICKDITIFYGNNGSGKSTILHLLANLLNAKKDTEDYEEVIEYKGIEIHGFPDFVKSIRYKMNVDDYDRTLTLPKTIKLIRSEDIFKRINDRILHNKETLLEEEKAKRTRADILSRGYCYKSLKDYDDLVRFIEALKLSKRQYVKAHCPEREMMFSNGQTALLLYEKNFEEGGIYLLDEPENCLSPVYQLKLMEMIIDAVKYFNCQFFICTHSPLILSLDKAVIYNLDLIPVITQKWEELENVKTYFQFFMDRKEKFKE